MASSSASTQTTAEARAAREGRRWRAAAFGLTIDGRDAIIGLTEGAASPEPDAPDVSLELTDRAALHRSWPRDGARRIAGLHAPMVIDSHPVAGYRMTGLGFGRAVIARRADRVRLAPVRRSRWRWHRYLLGQVLPFVAGLNGIESLHAGAVLLRGALVGVVGASGRGKSSLIAALVNRGAGFATDDVLALTRRRGRVVGHPGPGVLIVDERSLALQTRTPGRQLVRAQGEVALALQPAPAAPIAALCFLDGQARRIVVDEVPAGDPRRLLGSAYEVVRRDPERLRAQLELTAELAAGVRLISLRRPAAATPDAVAAALLSELGYDG